MSYPDALSLIAESHYRLTGRRLVELTHEIEAALWNAPCAIVAHGTERDPIFFYGNATALALFELSFEQFSRLPSRLSAEPLHRDERASLLDRVTRDGFIDDYVGIRVSSSGRRFRIEQATVWNLIDPTGQRHGQAAAFDRWTMLD
jgi:PAS domain-containing protein